MCHRTGIYTVCRCVSTSFSMGILQAGRVKGLRNSKNSLKTGYHNYMWNESYRLITYFILLFIVLIYQACVQME